MNYYTKYHLCRSCNHARIIKRKGFVCNITKNKPNYNIFCNNFSLNKIRDDKIIHNSSSFDEQTRAIIFFAVFATIALTVITRSIFFIIIFILGGLFYYNFVYRNEKSKKIHRKIGWFNYFTVLMSAEVINKKKNKSEDDVKIVQQFLIRLNGNKLAETCLEYMENGNIKAPDYNLLYSQIKKKLSKPEKLILYNFLFQLSIYKNIEQSALKYMFNLSRLFLINKKQFNFIKINSVHAERNDQEKQYESQENRQGQGKANSSSKLDLKYCYQVLGIEPSASIIEIKKSFRKLVHVYHPDKENYINETNKNNSKKFQELIEAYEKIKRDREIK